jgi:hypothetical protein
MKCKRTEIEHKLGKHIGSTAFRKSCNYITEHVMSTNLFGGSYGVMDTCSAWAGLYGWVCMVLRKICLLENPVGLSRYLSILMNPWVLTLS